MKPITKNTKKRGVFKFFIYSENKQFVGVCLTLNIVEEGKNPQEILNHLIGAAFNHLKVVIKENLSDDLLNRPAPKEYWGKYEAYKKEQFLKSVKKITNWVPKIPFTPQFIKHEEAYC